MPRAARIVIPGLPHHVMQRGYRGRDVFWSDPDRSAYLEMLHQQARQSGLGILGYCLMSNHVHLVVVPRTSDSLAQAVGRTHWLYSQHAGHKGGRKDQLWQSRFFSCALDEAHLGDMLLFVERNPVRSRQARYPWAYRWSSAAAHSHGTDPAGLLDLDRWKRLWTPSEWRSLLVSPDDERVTTRIRLHTSTGRPLATDATLDRLERRLGRRLRALPVGRPRKKAGPKTRR